MQTERYHVMLKGELVPGTNTGDAKSDFAKHFQLKTETVDTLFDGQVRPLKKNLAWMQAVQLKQQLHQIGVLVHLRVVMDALSWKHAMVSVRKVKIEPIPQPSERLLEIRRLRPVFFSIPGVDKFTDHKGRYLGALKTERIILSPLSGLLLAGAFGFLCQVLFVRIYESYFLDSHISIAGASIIFLVILMLHPLAMPRWRLSLTDERHNSLFTLVERRSLHYLKRKFDIVDAQGSIVARCERHRFQRDLVCECSQGGHVYRVEVEVEAHDAAMNVATALRQRLVDYNLLDTIQARLGRHTKQRPSAVIRDAEGNIVAQVGMENPSHFRWNDPKAEQRHPWVLLLTTCLQGN